jgi:uncharacterized protein (TIGR00730 family)
MVVATKDKTLIFVNKTIFIMRRICVFCGSAPGTDPAFLEIARSLGHLMATRNMALVYGGGRVGLMGAIADAVLERGGEVIGVIPDFLWKKEVGHTGLTELRVVESMHERKQQMATLADGFIALPGGWGTLEELAEVLTWQQLELLTKPIALMNTSGYYDQLLGLFRHMETMGLLRPHYLSRLIYGTDPEEVILKMTAYTERYESGSDLSKA